MLYAGCLDSDPFFSLKAYDQIIVSKLRSKGITVRELHKELPLGKVFRKFNRHLLYPRLVRKASRNSLLESNASSLKPKTSDLKPPIFHIGSQCYAHLIPVAQCLRPKAQRLISITVHDVAEFDYPEGYSPAQYRRVMKRLSCIKQADLVFAISEFTKQQLIEKAGVPGEKIVVNASGVGSEFRLLEEEGLNACRNSLGVKCEILGFKDLGFKQKNAFLILATGIDIYRKNLPALLRAVEELGRRGVNVTLIKTGDPIPRSLTSKVQSLKIINLGFVSQTELISLYNLCDVLAMPSLYEGFGLPVVEAQKCGLPCVISNAASLPEVGGDGALYHDPKDTEQLADHLQRVCEDQQLRGRLIKNGLKNARRFSWEKHVDTLIDSWEPLTGF